jgi:uncharacterized protein YecT (DUF1311 family)
MLRIAFIAAAALIGAAAFAYAQDPPETDNACDGGTLQLIECIEAKTKPWDKRMNAAYQDALKDAQPGQREQLRAAQRLWVQYRDANCAYYQLGQGSIARVQAEDCMFRMTKARAKELDGSDDRLQN